MARTGRRFTQSTGYRQRPSRVFALARTVAASSDDALEQAAGTPSTTSATNFALETNDHIGVRFTNIAIPKNSTIQSARLYFTVGDSTKNDAQGNWHCHAADNSATFTTTDGDVDGRTKTTASVAWTTNDLGAEGDRVYTPDVAGPVQEIINRAGWVDGNALTFLYQHTDGTDDLHLVAFDHATLLEPALEIIYVPATAQQIAVGQAIETETAQALGKSKSLAVGQAISTEIAQALTVRKSVAVGQAIETELGQTVGKSKTLAVGQSIETELGQPVGKSKARAVGQASEAELALAIGSGLSVAVGQAIETETALAVTVRKLRAVGQPSELETAFTVTARKTKTVDQAIETETAFPIATGVIVEPNDLDLTAIPGSRTLVAASTGQSLVAVPSRLTLTVVED